MRCTLRLWPLLAMAICQAALGQPASLDDRLEEWRATHDLPAFAGLVTTADETVAIGAVGVRALGESAEVTNDDLWHLGSCTKSMTATIAAILIERGDIDWDTTVAEIFGDEFDDLHESYRDATLEQFLCHRGGGFTGPPPAAWSEARRQNGTIAEQRTAFVRAVLTQPAAYEPGTQYQYSNQGSSVAGAMCERVTGKLWEDLARELLFEPLGMQSAGFGVPGTNESVDQPRGHIRAAALTIPPRPMDPGPYSDNPPAITPAGRVHMSLEDWAKYIREHLRGRHGESDLLSQETFERLHTDPFGGSYAMGWGSMHRGWGGQVIAHSGSNTMWYCTVWASPEKQFAVLVATNIAGDPASTACDQAAGALIGAYLGGELAGSGGPEPE